MEKKQYNLPLKYQGYTIVLQEVPDEISLAFNIAGCPHHCKGCHSPNLWDYEGNYLGQDLLKVLSKYKPYISCVCFLGGDQNLQELYEHCETIKAQGLKVCIYSGLNNLICFKRFIDNELIDYLKLGEFKLDKGGINNPNTNQVMYKIENKNLKNITNRFQKCIT